MKKILIVEDDRRILASLTVRLRAAGYEVMTATDGLSALEFAASKHPELILLDVGMPVVDLAVPDPNIWAPLEVGVSIAEELRRLHLDSIPVIYLTANRRPGLREKAVRLGAAAFFEKPFDSGKLMQTVARVLEQQPNLSSVVPTGAN